MLRSDSLKITQEILGQIARIDEFKGAWRALGTLAPDSLSALRRGATIESIGSSTRIEGSKLSDREVEDLLSNLAIQSFATRDEQEVAGYAELVDLVFSSWHDISFNENRIKQLHQILLRHSEKDSRHRGQHKTHSNSVAAFDENGGQIGIVFETATPFDTPQLMANLVAWVNDEREKRQLHPLLIIALFVVVFLEIHPFQDGNGRLSRVLAVLPDLSLQIVEFTREHGRITMGDAIKLTKANRNTLKQHFRNLVERGHLTQHGSGRGVWYELK